MKSETTKRILSENSEKTINKSRDYANSLATMKTPEYYLDVVAKERGFVDYGYMAVSLTDDGLADRLIKYTSEAMLRHSKEACEEQKKLCADVAKMTCDGDPDMLDGHRCNYGEYVINKQSILNAKSPIE